MAACACAAALAAFRKRPSAALFAPLAGASLVFLGLYAVSYGIRTGLLFELTVDEIIEIVIKVYCLAAGALLIRQGWRLRAATP
jgi:hypothetical protein